MTEVTSDAGGYQNESGNFLWMGAALFGVLCIVTGGVFLVNIHASVATLVVLTGIMLIVSGIGQLLLSNERSGWDWFVAALLVGAGIAAIAFYDLTVWALVLLAGISMIVAGVVQIVAALTDPHPSSSRGLGVLNGALAFVLGVVALAWPAATVFVIAVIFGIRIISLGVMSLIAANEMHKALNA